MDDVDQSGPFVSALTGQTTDRKREQQQRNKKQTKNKQTKQIHLNDHLPPPAVATTVGRSMKFDPPRPFF